MSNQMVTADKLDLQQGVQTEPLSDRDIQMIHRYLGDPTVFPREFKKWVTEHSSDTVDIAKTQVHGLVSESGQVVIGGATMEMMGAALCGCIFPFAANIQPPGWLICDGGEYSRTDYDALWKLLGTAWGAPSSGAVFKVPDFRGRAPFGASGESPFTQNEGAAAGARGPRHYHSVYDSRAFTAYGVGYTGPDGTHAHAMGGGAGAIAGSQPVSTYYPEIHGGLLTADAGQHGHNFDLTVAGTHTIHVNTEGASGPKDVVGWVGINWIIGTGKLPS